MPDRHVFTVKDVCAALGGISRSRVHAWVQFPPFSAMPSQERSARRYSRVDLLTFALLHTMEEQFGARRVQLAGVATGIRDYLSAPHPMGKDDWLFIPLADASARPVHEKPITEAGWVMHLARERERVDRYLGVLPPQRELPLMADVGQASP
jgi:hypothetical protein